MAPRPLPVVLGAALLAILATTALSRHPERPVVGDDALARAQGGRWVTATSGDVAVPVAGGGDIVFMRGARGHVIGTSAATTAVVLERGRLELRDPAGAVSKLRVLAGPYRAFATAGTSTLFWSPDGDRFSVRVREGSITASGCAFGSAYVIAAGRSVDASCSLDRVQDRESVDVDVQIARGESDPGALLVRGDASLRAGDIADAKLAFVTIRARSSSEPEAGVAAVRLGEIELRELGDYANAALWFTTYLQEEPHGALANEAQTRLMECLYRMGDYGGAARMASEYIAAHPSASPDHVARVILRDDVLPLERTASASAE